MGSMGKIRKLGNINAQFFSHGWGHFQQRKGGEN